MFNKNKKRIEELERQVLALQSVEIVFPVIKADAITKNLHFGGDMVCIKGDIEITVHNYFMGDYISTEPKDFYFLKGTEPKCDFIKEDINGKLSYYKNNVECDMGGKLKK